MKFNNIEDWCNEVDKLPRRMYNGKEAVWLADLLFKEDGIDRSVNIQKLLEDKKLGYASVIWLRVKCFHSFTISPSLALFLGDIVSNLGTSTMISNFLQYKEFLLKLKHNLHGTGTRRKQKVEAFLCLLCRQYVGNNLFK